MKNTSYFLGIMMAVIGLIMLFAAESIVKILVIVLGISALLDGVFILTSLLPLSEEQPYRIECIVRAAISIIIGLLCVILPIAMVEFVWTVFVYVFAVYALISAGLLIASTIRLYSDGFPVKRNVVEIIATAVLAIVLFMLPSSFGFTLIRIGGIIMIISGAATAIIAYKNRDIVLEDVEVRD